MNIKSRIATWESVFKKYENVGATPVYVYANDYWEHAEKVDSGKFPADLKTIIDQVWEDDRNDVLKKHIEKDDCFDGVKDCAANDCDTYLSDKSGSEYDTNDDDYESYQSDIDSEDMVTVSNEEFLAALSKTTKSRLRSHEKRKEKLDRVLNSVLARQTEHENGKQTDALSSLSDKKFSPKKKSPEKSTRSCVDGNSSTFASTFPSQRDRIFSFKLSPSRHLLSALQPSIEVRDGISSTDNVRLTEKTSSSETSTFSEHLSRLKIDSPSNKQKRKKKLDSILDSMLTRQTVHKDGKQTDAVSSLSAKKFSPKKKLPQKSTRSCDFSEHLNRLKIDSSNEPKKKNTPRRLTQKDGTTPRFYDNSRERTDDAVSPPFMSPSDRNKKRKFEIRLQENCERSPKLSRINFSGLEEGLAEDRETNEGVISVPSPQSRLHGILNDIRRQPGTASQNESINELHRRPSSALSASSNMSGKVVNMNSSTLRRKSSGEKNSVRALMKGRSIFEL